MDEHRNNVGDGAQVTHPEQEALSVSEVPGWRPIETAPGDGRKALVFRPLAHLTNDEPVAVKRLVGSNNHCWSRTVPDGQEPCNPTDGSCHVTHWMPLPAPPVSALRAASEASK